MNNKIHNNLPDEAEITKYVAEVASKCPPIDMNTPLITMRVCASSPVPQGWIKVDDDWSPTSCGNPSSIVYNIWIIERYQDKPIGSTMRVCSGAPTPVGWVEINKDWSPTSCGHPSSIVYNVKVIQRVS